MINILLKNTEKQRWIEELAISKRSHFTYKIEVGKILSKVSMNREIYVLSHQRLDVHGKIRLKNRTKVGERARMGFFCRIDRM